MTPQNICGMAYVKGLQAIAVTDHNTARNLPAVKAAAEMYGLFLVPGIEVTTREEVHLLGYFSEVEAAVEAGHIFTAHLPGMRNRPEFFGHQYVMDADDQVLEEESALLIGATDLSLAACVEIIRSHGGAAVPAHINRGSNGLLVNLGMMPEKPDFPVVEAARQLPVAAAALTGRRVLHSSDAHQLGAILEPEFDLPVSRCSPGDIMTYLLGK